MENFKMNEMTKVKQRNSDAIIILIEDLIKLSITKSTRWPYSTYLKLYTVDKYMHAYE